MPAASTASRRSKARIPYANVGLVKLPDQAASDDQAILISDIFPTGYQFDSAAPAG